MSKKDFLILVGPGGSGKDYARSLIQKNNLLKYGVPVTTRPPRSNEINGQDYHFISNSFFEKLLSEFAWHNKYIDFYYGALKLDFRWGGKFFIIAPTSIGQLSKEIIDRSFILYFDIPEKIREERMSKRQNNIDSVKRRLKSDAEDFRNYKLFSYKITNPNFTYEDLKDIITKNVIINA